MKNIILIATTSILFSLSLNAQQRSESFYYCKEEKIFLQQRADKIYIKFAANSDKEQVRTFIGKDTSLRTSKANLDNRVSRFAILESKRGENISSETIEAYKARLDVISVNFISEYEGRLQGVAYEFVVKLKKTTSFSQLQEIAKQNNCTIGEENQFVKNQFMVSVPKTAHLDAIQMSCLFYETELFEFASPNFLVFNAFHSNDTYYVDQWGLKNIGQYGGMAGMDINIEQAWALGITGSGIKVAVIDEGVDLTHPDLLPNLLPGMDFTGNNTGGAPADSLLSHGVACAGIIGAVKDNGIGISGVAPDCRIIPICVSDNNGMYQQNATDGINWAWKNGADVISCSWGGGFPYPPTTEAIDSSVRFGRNSKGCVLLFSSGNGNDGSVGFPANLSNVMAIGAMSPCGERKSPTSCDGENWGSTYGLRLSVIAPGVLIASIDIQRSGGYNPNDPIHPKAWGNKLFQDYADQNYTVWFNGTSSACPSAAGVAALVLSVNPELTWSRVQYIIESTAKKVRPDLYNYSPDPILYPYAVYPHSPFNIYTGYGLVDAGAAVLAATCSNRAVDFVIRNHEKDEGIEPDTASEVRYSPDLWVRNKRDSLSVHQNALPNQTNYVYVRIKNTGNRTTHGNDKVFLYWAKTDNNMTWSSHWDGSNPLLGNLIDSAFIPSLPPCGEEVIIEIPWNNVPNPADYSGISKEPWEFCLLARVVSDMDTMTAPETANIISNVRGNNHIACRIIDVGKIDLMIADDISDNGSEPNTASIIWNSPSIWVKHQPSGDTIHQDPMPLFDNTVYVKVKNCGIAPFKGKASDKIDLYWGKSDTSMEWDRHWIGVGYYSTGQKKGTYFWTISLDSVDMFPNEEIIFLCPWKVPDPIGYCSINNQPEYFYILARILSEKDMMTFQETEDVFENTRQNNNIALKSVNLVHKQINLMIKDTPYDIGIEPNPTVTSMSESPSIWTRRNQDSSFVHQNPTSGDTNYIYIRIENSGIQPSVGNEKLYIYWAKDGTSLAWDSCWRGDYFPNRYALLGDFIDSIILPVIPCGEEIIVEIPWKAPNHNDYYGISTDLYTFNLLARIVSEQDTMTFTETSDIMKNVKNNNKIAIKSVSSCPAKPDLMIADYAGDNGTEPSGCFSSNSPDIWCCSQPNDSKTLQKLIPNDTVFVHVKVKNRGCLTSNGDEVLKLYWAKREREYYYPSWNSSWVGNYFPNSTTALTGDFIDSITIPKLEENQDTVLIIPWQVPHYKDYCGIVYQNVLYDFYLLGITESKYDTLNIANTADINVLVQYNNNVAMKQVELIRRDLLIRDTLTDIGTEPSTCEIISESPDIWTVSWCFGQIRANRENTVNVRITNKGCTSSDGGVLKLYYAKTDNDMAWSSKWNLINSIPISSLKANESSILKTTWYPPHPFNYPNSTNPNAFTLLARIEENNDTASLFESQDWEQNVRNNRGIAAKNVHVYDTVQLIIRDNEGDIGLEPNPYTGNVLQSPDISVVNWNGSRIFDYNGGYEIHYKISNLGDCYHCKEEGASMSFYWGKVEANPTWTFIAKQNIFDVEPGKDYTLSVSWRNIPTPVPNPTSKDSTFYVLAVIDRNNGQITNLPSGDSNSVKGNIRDASNMACNIIRIGEKTIDLMTRDCALDLGKEPCNLCSVFWESPDIYVRKQQDGNTNTNHENPRGNAINYVYVRIKNIGKTVSTGTERLYLHYSKSGTGLDWSSAWDGTAFFDPPSNLIPMGNIIANTVISPIQPGHTQTFEIPWFVPDPAIYVGLDGVTDPWHFCLLSRIVSLDNDPMTFPEVHVLRENVVGNNNISQRNVDVVEVKPGGSISGTVYIRNFSDTPETYCLRFKPELITSVTLVQEAEVTIKLGDALYNAWLRGGKKSQGVEIKADNTFLIKNTNANLCNLILDPEEIGRLSVKFNFLTRKITPQLEYDFYVVQTDYQTDEIIGGETYHVITPSRTPFYAQANDVYAFKNELITLKAADIGEPAIYRWYDPNGMLVSEDMSFQTIALQNKTYKLEVIALADGYKDYATAMVKIVPGKIEELFPNPTTNDLNIVCVVDNGSGGIPTNSKVQITNAMGVIFNTFSMTKSPQGFVIDVSNYPVGAYTVTLFCNGAAADTRTFVKE